MRLTRTASALPSTPLLAALLLAACSPQAPTPPAASQAASAASQAQAATTPSEAETRALLQAQADRWDQAIVARRREDIAANMAEDFRQIDGEGHVEDRASFLEGLLDPKLQLDPYKVEDFDIRLYGDVALLSGRTRMTGRYDGKVFKTHYRYIDIYVKRHGAWKIVSVQISKLPPDSP